VRTAIRLLVVLIALSVVLQVAMLWDATDRRWFTVIPSPALEAMQQQQGALTDLFGPVPGSSAAAPLPPIDNLFRLGILPAGPGAGLASVLTLTLPILALAGIALVAPILLRVPQAGPSSDRPARPTPTPAPVET